VFNFWMWVLQPIHMALICWAGGILTGWMVGEVFAKRPAAALAPLAPTAKAVRASRGSRIFYRLQALNGAALLGCVTIGLFGGEMAHLIGAFVGSKSANHGPPAQRPRRARRIARESVREWVHLCWKLAPPRRGMRPPDR
jgi:hypothetical protein